MIKWIVKTVFDNGRLINIRTLFWSGRCLSVRQAEGLPLEKIIIIYSNVNSIQKRPASILSSGLPDDRQGNKGNISFFIGKRFY